MARPAVSQDVVEGDALLAARSELGQRGANADVKHPDRAEWERLRAVIANPPDAA